MLTATACGPILKGGAIIPQKGNVTVDPPPPRPTPTHPTVPYVPEKKANEGVVVIDVTDADAKVSLVLSTRRDTVHLEGHGNIGGGSGLAQEDTQLLCAHTPCAVSIPVGSHSLVMEAAANAGWDSSTDHYDIDVVPNAQQITHTMSRTRVTKAGHMATGVVADVLLETFGWTAICLSPIGFAPGAGGAATFGGLLVGGAVLVLLGYMAYEPPVAPSSEIRTDSTTLSAYPAP
jgi:hypothetical protein